MTRQQLQTFVPCKKKTFRHPTKYSREAPRALRLCGFPYVRSKFSDDPDRSFHPRFSTRPDTALAMVTDLWACIVRGPPVGERLSVAECVFPRRRTETRWLCEYFGSLAKGKIVFPHIILCSSTVERTALATRPSSAGTGHVGHGDGGPLPGHGERGVSPLDVLLFFPRPKPLSLLETLAAAAISCKKS
jgi:hypothetical protein